MVEVRSVDFVPSSGTVLYSFEMLGILLALLAVVLIFHVFIYHKYNWPSYVRTINKIPGPKGIFYFGSTLRFYMQKNEDMMADFGRDFKEWGRTFRHWYSGVAVVFVSDITDIQTLLMTKHPSKKGTLYKNILPWLGTGLLTSNGEKWHTMRKIITPTFHFSILQNFLPLFNKNARTMVKLIEEDVGKECELHKYVTFCALDIIGETAMGITLNTQTSSSLSDYVAAIFKLGKIVVDRMFSPIFFTDHNFALSPLGWEQRKLLKSLHGFTSSIIQKKKQQQVGKEPEINSNFIPNTENLSDNVYYKKRSSFLEMLLEKQKMYSLTDVNIREEVDTFMFEGHDTTSAAISWTLYEVGHHPEVQEKIQEELNFIFGDSERDPTYQDLMNMTYLKRVVQETLRLYPSVPLISRQFDVDIQLKEYLIPANTEIVFNIYFIHRNPEIFPEPEKFDPDRFLPEEIEKRQPFAYIPFSAGARNCVGQKFAVLEELVILSSILRNYNITSLDPRGSVKVIPEMILRPHKKLMWSISKRNRLNQSIST